MNILDSLQYGRRQQALATEGVMSLLVPVAATGLVVSIGDVLRDTKKIQRRKFLNSAAEKIQHALRVANRDGTTPQLSLAAEETGILNAVIGAIEWGMTSVLETFVGALFSFVPTVIEAVAVPMFSVATWTIMEFLPLLLTPEGLAAVGAVAVGGLAFYLYRRWSNKDTSAIEISQRARALEGPIVGSGPESAIPQGAPPGIRNNNPGNLEYAGQPYSLPKTGRFAQFATQAQGLYNAARQIELDYSRGLNSVTKIVSVWAPRSDNDTAAYIKGVSDRMHVGPIDQLDLSDPKILKSMLSAIIVQENGMNPYSDEQLDAAVAQALQFAKNGYKDLPVSALTIPTSGIVSSPFGHRGFITEGATTEHMGVDIAGTEGQPVYAAEAGTVEIASVSRGYGNLVQIRGSSFWTRYGHLSAFSVTKGATVAQGQEIGKMGNTGVSTGAHLHFEVQPLTAKAPVDPATYLPELAKGAHVATSGDHPQNMTVLGAVDDKTFINKDGRKIALQG